MWLSAFALADNSANGVGFAPVCFLFTAAVWADAIGGLVERPSSPSRSVSSGAASPMTVPEESEAASLVVGSFPLTLGPPALGICFSSNEDTSDSLESSLLADELVL